MIPAPKKIVEGTTLVNTGSAGAPPAQACAARSILETVGNKGASRFALIAGEAPAFPVVWARSKSDPLLGKSQ